MTGAAHPSAIAAGIIRQALRIDPTVEDTTPLSVSVRYTLAASRTSERTQIVAHLAVLCAAFARLLPAEVIDSFLRAAEQPPHDTAVLAEVYKLLRGAENLEV